MYLLRDATVFNDNAQLFKEVFSCVKDMMCGKVIIKGINYHTKSLIASAHNICFSLATAMRPLEIETFLDVVLPIPDEISSTDSELKP